LRPSPFPPDRVLPPPSGSLAFGEPHGFAGSHTASPGASNADIRSNPLRRHFVPPKVAQALVHSVSAVRVLLSFRFAYNPLASHDAQLRQAAFSRLKRLATLRGGVLDSGDVAGGCEFDGERIPLVNPPHR
jgi:hypothetical protein